VNNLSVSRWIEDLPKKGINTFSLEEAKKALPNISDNAVKRAIDRAIAGGKLQSVWRGYYAIVLYDYGLRGIIPPLDYIDQLFGYLDKNYYIALLSAASLQGSSHQAVQTFTIMHDGSSLRNKEDNGIRIEFFKRNFVPNKYVNRIVGKSAELPISSPELTALDLVWKMHSVGGLNRVAGIINELTEVMSFKNIGIDFIKLNGITNIQRLGYLLEHPLRQLELAESLYSVALSGGAKFRKTSLVSDDAYTQNNMLFDKKWKILINEEVELD
jgi:predicted transcriptional regulator of viral defense system